MMDNESSPSEAEMQESYELACSAQGVTVKMKITQAGLTKASREISSVVSRLEHCDVADEDQLRELREMSEQLDEIRSRFIELKETLSPQCHELYEERNKEYWAWYHRSK